MALVFLAVATGALVVWNACHIFRIRDSAVWTSGHKRHLWGQQFIGLMVLAAILLETPLIGLLFSIDK